MLVNAPNGLDKQPLVLCVSKGTMNTREPRQSEQPTVKKKSGVSFSEVLDNEMASEQVKAIPSLRTFI